MRFGFNILPENGYPWVGREKKKAAPLPSVLSAQIRPP